MEEKDRLLLEKNKADRLSSLTKQTGWIDVKNMLVQEYHDSFDILKDKTVPEKHAGARAIIEVIEKLYAFIDNSIEIGKIAYDKYQDKYLNKR